MIIINKMHQQFMAARRAGTPIIAIKSLDPEMSIQALQSIMTANVDLGWAPTPIIQHDCINGWMARNDEGRVAIDKALDGKQLESTVNAIEMLILADKLPFNQDADRPTNPILFVLNAHSYIDRSYGARADFIQALWNLRLPFRDSLRSVVLIGPDFDFPPEIRHDILILDEPLPTDDQITKIVSETCDAAGIKTPEPEIAKAVDALRGLVAFEAEQATAMCISPKTGLDTAELWQRKKQLISATKGLSIYSSKETFKDIGGCEQVKKFMLGVINGKEAPKVIVFIDEGEKMFSGAVGDAQDSSGTSQDALGTTLKFMEDHEADGAIFVGPPGAAKSAIAKAAGNEAEIPTIVLDMGAAKGSLVGESEATIRQAYKIIDAVGGGQVYFIMTCNRIAILPPELKRRFTSGIFYFEIPDAYSNYKERSERDAIWSIFLSKYSLDATQVKKVDDTGWTGAEIRNCCRLAYRFKISLKEASEYIVPVIKSAGGQIESLRREASGKYLCANRPGIYEFKEGGNAPSAVLAPAGKRMFATNE